MSEYAPAGHEQLGPTPLVRDALIAATFDPHRALDPSVERLRLYDSDDPTRYNLRAEVEDPLRAATFHGPAISQKEHGVVIAATNGKKLAIQSRTTQGTETQVHTGMSYYGGYVSVAGEQLYVQDRYVAAVPHTHPEESPPSPKDLIGLFYDSENVAAETAAWVITKSGTYMVFRGANTPEWPQEQSDAKAEVWKGMVNARIRQNMRHGMSESEMRQVNYRAQIAFLRQCAEKYDLQVFVGSKDSAELIRF